MSKESTRTQLDRIYDFLDEAAAMGHSFEDHLKAKEAEVSFDRERAAKFFTARKSLRNGYAKDLDLDNVDIDQVREDLGVPRGHEGTLVIKAEIKRLKELAHKTD